MLILLASQHARPKPDATRETQPINASTDIHGSALFNPLCLKWFVASRLRTDCQLRSTDSATPPADSHCPTPLARLAPAERRRDGLCVLARTI